MKSNTSKSSIKRLFKQGFFSLLIVPVICFSCSSQDNTESLKSEIVSNSYDGSENFELYVTKFYRDLGVYGIYPKKPKETIIKFSKLDQMNKTTHIHGVSFGRNDDDKIEIYINPSSWGKFSKTMRYILMYHELAHDILNLDDLENKAVNKGKLMYPEISSYENKNMDDFIESMHALFEEQITGDSNEEKWSIEDKTKCKASYKKITIEYGGENFKNGWVECLCENLENEFESWEYLNSLTSDSEIAKLNKIVEQCTEEFVVIPNE